MATKVLKDETRGEEEEEDHFRKRRNAILKRQRYYTVHCSLFVCVCFSSVCQYI